MLTAADIEQQGAIVTVRLEREELTHVEMQEVVDACRDRMRYDNARHFIFDLQPVTYLASSCLGILVSLMQEAEHVRGRIMLVHVHDNVAFLFKVTQLDSVFGIFDEIEDAMNEL
ncbi:MAG: STAS domain-containing protein [Rhodospirillales bacterium]|nr:STAS domain-containing protein [Rhodospirillales bacterium]